MLGYLKPDPNTRKPLLLTAACCQRVWELLPDYCRNWVHVVEQVAEGQLAPERLNDDWEAVEMFLACYDNDGPCYAVINVAACAWQEWDCFEPGNRAWRAERQRHASLIRDIFGNPFRPVKLDPTWRVRKGGSVPNVAQAIYEERRFGDMPVLADALEEAGCTEQAILSHCRQPGEHVRGCWVIDLLLGKD
jgi:hypothetical protein